MSCSEDDTVDGSDGGEQQRRRQTSAPEPFCMASKDTGGYENIVSRSRGELSVASSGVKNSWGCWLPAGECTVGYLQIPGTWSILA
jgi:hypothetical protein